MLRHMKNSTMNEEEDEILWKVHISINLWWFKTTYSCPNLIVLTKLFIHKTKIAKTQYKGKLAILS